MDERHTPAQACRAGELLQRCAGRRKARARRCHPRTACGEN